MGKGYGWTDRELHVDRLVNSLVDGVNIQMDVRVGG